MPVCFICKEQFRAHSPGLWTHLERENAHQKASLLNRKMCGGLIAYVLRRPVPPNKAR